MKELFAQSVRCEDEVAASRRRLPDRRRSFSTVNLRHLGWQARRQERRRYGDANRGYVDSYNAALLVPAIGIVVCCCLDAFFTLTLLQLGAVELNALMARLIESDVQSFVNYKVGMTSLSVILLIIHKNFRIFRGLRVEHLLYGLLAAYLTLIGYELALLANPPL